MSNFLSLSEDTAASMCQGSFNYGDFSSHWKASSCGLKVWIIQAHVNTLGWRLCLAHWGAPGTVLFWQILFLSFPLSLSLPPFSILSHPLRSYYSRQETRSTEHRETHGIWHSKSHGLFMCSHKKNNLSTKSFSSIKLHSLNLSFLQKVIRFIYSGSQNFRTFKSISPKFKLLIWFYS